MTGPAEGVETVPMAPDPRELVRAYSVSCTPRDYCANAGGIIFLVEERAGRVGSAGHRIAAIGDTLTRIWQRAWRDHVPPEQVAEAIATGRLAAARAAARGTGRGAGR